MPPPEYANFEIDGRMRDPEQQEKLELREEELRQEHTKYLQQHPELRQVLNDFMSSVLLHQPEHAFDFAREYFSAFAEAEPGDVEAVTADAAERAKAAKAAESSGAAAESSG
mmetsp:Transcript_97750/g.273580  ORF Transcript_97750/g.273580 Transcript_97750/m.273580 type:complete len:112 (-) Transcript_97750:190-525(-)